MNKPEPNTTVEIEDVTVEYRVCPDACCKPDKRSKHRFYVYRDNVLIQMSNDWNLLCEQRGWT